MSDTVAVALIAVAGTLGSGGLSYLAARRNTEVQLHGVHLEMEQLRATHAEEQRRERQQAYHEYVTAVHGFRQLADGIRSPVTEEAFLELTIEFGEAHMKTMLLGDEDVVEKMAKTPRLCARWSHAIEEADPSVPFEKRLRDSFDSLTVEWAQQEGELIRAMKDDIAAMFREERSLRGRSAPAARGHIVPQVGPR